jgi:hypothetical protein
VIINAKTQLVQEDFFKNVKNARILS